MISKIERGLSVPTATVLGKLAAALGLGLSQLLGRPFRREPRLLRRGDQAVFRDPSTGFVRRALSPLFDNGGIDLALNTLPAGQVVTFPAHHVGVEEHLVVQSGRLIVVVDGIAHRLRAGETLFYPADRSHEFRNPGRQAAVFLIVVDDRSVRS